MAHMRAYFQKALLQGKDEKARSLMGLFFQPFDSERVRLFGEWCATTLCESIQSCQLKWSLPLWKR